MKKLFTLLVMVAGFAARASDPNPTVTASAFGRSLIRQADAAAARTVLGVAAGTAAVTNNQSGVTLGGTFTGNGAGLSGITATAVVTNLASQTNTGAISTNHYNKLERDNDKPGAFRHPPFFLDTWYHYGTGWTYSDFTNELALANTYGLTRMYDCWIIIDDGWQGGITNGIVMPSNTKFPYASVHITNFCGFAHSNNWKVFLYMEPQPATDTVGSPTMQTNWQANAAAWRTWGVDGIKMDQVSSITDYSNKLDQFRGLINDAKRGFGDKELVFFSGGWRDSQTDTTRSNLFLGQLTELINCVRLIPDDLGADLYLTYSNYLATAIPAYERNKQYNRPGHLLHFDVAQSLPASFSGTSSVNWDATNLCRAQILMNAMMQYPMDVPLVGDPVNDPTRWYRVANQALVGLHGDVLMDPCYLMSSNNLGSRWIKRLANGSKAVAFLNHQTNQTLFTTNVLWVELGYTSNQLCSVYDVWNQSWITNAYGGFSTVVSNMSAWAYVIGPTNIATSAPAAVVQTTVPLGGFVNIDGQTITAGNSGDPGYPGLLFFGNSGLNNRLELSMPKECVTNTTLKVVFRMFATANGTLPLYFLFGWEKGGVAAFDAATPSLAMTSGTRTYYTNTFTVTANPDACGLRFGTTAAATNNLFLENITILSQ
jgi:hypothetical protein